MYFCFHLCSTAQSWEFASECFCGQFSYVQLKVLARLQSSATKLESMLIVRCSLLYAINDIENKYILYKDFLWFFKTCYKCVLYSPYCCEAKV